MPDAEVLDKLLLSLVELIEANMGVCLSTHPVGKSEASSFCFWELNENNATLNSCAVTGNFRSKLIVMPTSNDASNCVHSAP
jgi:hypothetical protein